MINKLYKQISSIVFTIYKCISNDDDSVFIKATVLTALLIVMLYVTLNIIILI